MQTTTDEADRVAGHSIREVTAAAAAIFTESPRRAAAITYLKQRSIDAMALSPDWVLGYAPPGWTRLLDRMRRDFPDQALLDAGLARRSSRGTLIDTFRERVIFGIRDRDGTVAGFIGRDLSGHPAAPRYLNTRQHALFDKSKLLFGFAEGAATPTVRQPVVVEGPLDVLAIAARQAIEGSSELLPVAACGTAFTATHARLVAEAAESCQPRVVVAMDGDPAGRAASLQRGSACVTLVSMSALQCCPNAPTPPTT